MTESENEIYKLSQELFMQNAIYVAGLRQQILSFELSPVANDIIRIITRIQFLKNKDYSFSLN